MQIVWMGCPQDVAVAQLAGIPGGASFEALRKEYKWDRKAAVDSQGPRAMADLDGSRCRTLFSCAAEPDITDLVKLVPGRAASGEVD